MQSLARTPRMRAAGEDSFIGDTGIQIMLKWKHEDHD
jgi:hypothetical protein